MKYASITLSALTFSLALSVGLSGCQSPGSSAQRNYPNKVAYTPDARPEGLVTIVAEQDVNQGIASSYDPRISRLETASGETYDPMEMTAAHSSYPFSTFVKVKNLENMKETVVRINDRIEGSDEAMKLSYAAAYRLGIYSGGKANIEITPLGYEGTQLSQGTNTSNRSDDVPVDSLSSKSQNKVLSAAPQVVSQPLAANEPQSASAELLQPAKEQSYRQPSLSIKPSISVVEVVRLQPEPIQNKALSKPSAENTAKLNNSLETQEQPKAKATLPTSAQDTNLRSSYIQIGAFRNKDYANTLLNAAQTIANATNTQVKVYESNAGGQPMYKVRFGPLSTVQVDELEGIVAKNNFNGLTIKN